MSKPIFGLESLRESLKCLLAAVLLAAIIFAPAAAQESAAFLKLGMGARAIALGGAYTALADDANALYWNPAGLAGLDRAETTMTHAQMFLGDSYDALSFSVPLGVGERVRQEDHESWRGHRTATAYYRESVPRGVLGFGLTRLAQADQEGRDENRRKTGGFDSSDMALTVGYARPLLRGLQGGFALKRITSRIGDAGASAIALDFGAVYHLGGKTRGAGAEARRWRLGFSARNIGQGLKFESESSPLPTSFSFAAAMQTKVGLLFTGEMAHRPHAAKTSFSFGTEYPLLPALTLRAGMRQEGAPGSGSGEASLLGAFGGGMGLKWSRFYIDYSMTPYGELGTVQRLSFRTQF